MSVIMGSARNGENGITGNKAGDQSGSEVSTQGFYVHSKGWYGFTPKTNEIAEKLASAMQDACNNDHIGYDQGDRGTLLTQYKQYGSIKAIKTDCECDCSSLVRVCIYQATGVLLTDFDTGGEPSVLASSGLFEDKIKVTSASQCTLGMVLVTQSKGHTAIIVSGAPLGGSDSDSGTSSGTTSGTKEVADAKSFDSTLAGEYEVNASDGLNMRYGAGTSYDVVTTLPKGEKVQNYGYYTTVDGTKWLVVVKNNGVKGFCSSKYLTKVAGNEVTTGTSGGEMTEKADEATVWNYLYSQIGNAYGTAGVMGNMYAESAMIPINLQNSYESKLGYTDKTYTEAVDNGTYTGFVHDSAGYGLVQWTYYTLKQGLLEYCQNKKASIGNMDSQLEYLCIELDSEFFSLWKTLKNATSVKEASDAMLTKFENPADQSDSVKNTRASYGQTYYDKYAGSSSSSSSGGTTSGTTGGTTSGTTGSTSSGSLTVDGIIGTKTVKKLQEVMGQTGNNVDGKIDGQQSASKQYWTSIDSSVCSWSGGSSAVVKKLQQFLKDKGCAPGTVDGKLGKKTAKALQNYLAALGYYTGSIDSYFGTNSAKALQKWLNTK